MKKTIAVLTGIAFAATLQTSAQTSIHPELNTPIQQMADPVGWESGSPAIPGVICVSRYGYWRNQPVKMAYWSAMPGHRVPPFFHIADTSGKIVYTGHPVRMRKPEAVMIPIGMTCPGIRIYALNFSGYTEPGSYVVEIPGYPDSGIFHIRGIMPEPVRSLPGLRIFELESGMTLNPGSASPAD